MQSMGISGGARQYFHLRQIIEKKRGTVEDKGGEKREENKRRKEMEETVDECSSFGRFALNQQTE